MNNRRLFGVSRRQIIRGLLATGAFGLTARLGTGCTAGSSNTSSASSPAGGGKDEPMTVGFIYVGPKDDYGYNQAHAEGAAAVAKKFSWVKLVEEANVPETTAVAESMRSMIDIDGA